MELDTNIKPAEVFPPGEFIRDELEARGWTQQDLADIMGRPLARVNQIITGARGITPETAKGLAAAFGTTAQFWLNLESDWQLSQLTVEADEVARRARLYAAAPVNEITRRGWIAATDNVDELEAQLKNLYEVSDLETVPQFKFAARKSTSYEENPTTAQLAWAARAKRLSRTVQAAKFDEKRFNELLPRLRAMTPNPENLRHLPRLLAEVGVKLVIVAHLKSTKIDGAALWVDGQPVVAMSLRFDRIDNFWHTLIHELVHIKNRDGDVVDSEIETCGASTESDTERRTNAETCALLVPQDKLQSFIVRVRPLYYETKIVQFAQTHGIHPGIVLGQLHHRGEVPPRNLRHLLVPIRHCIAGIAMTDGFGHVPGVV